MTNLIAVTHKKWIADHLGVQQHYGLDLVDTSDWATGQDGMWCPGQYMALVSMSEAGWVGVGSPAMRPTSTYRDVVSYLRVGPSFVKLANYKDERFPAQVYTVGSFVEQASHLPFAHTRDYQVSPELRGIVLESRHWVIDRMWCAGKVYRDEDVDFSGVGSDMGDAPKSHISHAKRKIQAMRDDSPPTYVIDIGELSTGEVFTVETNPAWCAGFYDVDPEVAREAVLKSQGRVEDIQPRHLWAIDLGTATSLLTHRLLRERRG